jgi:hypothetical protein
MSRLPTVIVLGDELESCLTALVLAWHGLSVVLLRESTGMLGGLSTRGGLSYMDLTPEFIPPMMSSVLKEAGLKRVALHSETAAEVLARRLKAVGVQVVSGASLKCLTEQNEAGQFTIKGVQDERTKTIYHADFYIDSTPDATFARQAGVPADLGLGGVFGTEENAPALGVSPVFRIRHLAVEALQKAEASLRQRADMPQLLEKHMPWLTSEERQTLIERPTYAPTESDYLDILNNIIGVAYHKWRYGDTFAYQDAPFWIDGFNISRLLDGTLGFNGLITRMPLEEQVRCSEERWKPTPAMQEEMQAFCRFLEELTQIHPLELISPEEVYIRQTFRLEALAPLTGRQLFQGGVHPSESIGTFSYWLDFRGIHPWQAYPDLHPMPKPCFNVGLNAHFPKPETVGLRNLAFIGRSSGFSPLAQGACRIVQYNAIVGEALAHHLALTLPQQKNTSAIDVQAIYESQARLAEILGERNPPQAGGYNTLTSVLEASALLRQDDESTRL